MARKPLKISVDTGDFYLKVTSAGTWGAFSAPADTVPEFEFKAPEDATAGELEGEIDYYLLNNTPDLEEVEEDEPDYAYNDRW